MKSHFFNHFFKQEKELKAEDIVKLLYFFFSLRGIDVK